MFNNQITDLSSLADLDRLWYLTLGNNHIGDLSPLADLRQL
ncbi:leucine-rich repeat domain-containing protein [Lyngbya aestuarii]